MKTLRLTALIGGALLLAAAGLPAQDNKSSGPAIKKREVARDKYEEMRSGGARAVSSGDEALSHGDLLVIRRKGNDTVSGVLVYQDAKNNRLLVRTRPNMAPVAVPMQDVQEIERIVPASTSGDKGGVRFANEAEARRAANYEIQTIEVFNGPVRSVSYIGKTLSAAERAQLDAMERAANRQADDAAMVETLSERALRGPERLDIAELVRQLTPQPPAFATAAINTNFPVNTPLFPYAAPFYGAGYGGFGYGGSSALTTALPAILNAGSSAPASAVIQIPERTQDNTAELVKALQTARESLAKSREDYAKVSNRARFDDNGRIVAVMLDEK